ENGWRGRPARPGRRPADRNCGEQRCEKAVPIRSNCRSRSVRRVAGRHRRVACATSKPFFKHALSGLELLSVLIVVGVQNLCAAESSRAVSIVVEPPLSRTAQHGIAKLQSALQVKGWIAQSAVSIDAA